MTWTQDLGPKPRNVSAPKVSFRDFAAHLRTNSAHELVADQLQLAFCSQTRYSYNWDSAHELVADQLQLAFCSQTRLSTVVFVGSLWVSCAALVQREH